MSRDKAQVPAHRHSSRLWWPDAEMLRVDPGRELAGPLLLGVPLLLSWLLPNTGWLRFSRLTFFGKGKNPLSISFFQLAQTGTSRSFVIQSFEKVGGAPCAWSSCWVNEEDCRSCHQGGASCLLPLYLLAPVEEKHLLFLDAVGNISAFLKRQPCNSLGKESASISDNLVTRSV